MKIYRRWQQNSVLESLVPQKRGPKFKSRRKDITIENEVIHLRREYHLNRHEIAFILRSKSINISSSTIYNIFVRHDLNKLSKLKSGNINNNKRNNTRIIMLRSGELVHLDLHHLSHIFLIEHSNRDYYFLGAINGFRRIAWVERLDLKRRFF
jgi:hypothetical protein